MNEFFINSAFAGVTISLVSYMLGMYLKKKFKLGIFNPLLIAIAVTMVILFALNVDYDTYNTGAKYLSWLLTPSTVCLAIPLYEQISLLKKNFAAVAAGIVAGVLASLLSIFIMAKLFGLGHTEYVTLLPKSITTAIGMGVSEELNGIVTITVAVIIITGVVGNVLADFVYKLFHVTHPVAKGVGLGTSAHAIGTAKALEMGEIEGAMGGLSIAVAGILTVIVAPIFSHIL